MLGGEGSNENILEFSEILNNLRDFHPLSNSIHFSVFSSGDTCLRIDQVAGFVTSFISKLYLGRQVGNVLILCLFRDNKELEEVKMSLGNLLKELEQIRATLTVHIDVGSFKFVYITGWAALQ